MIRSFYTLGTGMLVERSRMDVITNNIANVDTQGYKSDMMLSRSFSDMLITRMNDPSIVSVTNTIGGSNTGAHVDSVVTSFEQGAPQQTMLQSDICLVGDGFFAVTTADGTKYTRSGNFSVDGQGNLVDASGNLVESVAGQGIKLTTDNFTVGKTGIVTDDATGQNVGQLKIVKFEKMEELRKDGNNLFYNYLGTEPTADPSTEVLQGYLEGSNANITVQMTDMMTTMRKYESNQTALKMIDDSLSRTVNDIAKF